MIKNNNNNKNSFHNHNFEKYLVTLYIKPEICNVVFLNERCELLNKSFGTKWTYTHTNTHTHTHTHIQTYTHTHTHTNIHIHKDDDESQLLADNKIIIRWLMIMDD